MPIYEYDCKRCGKPFEKLVKSMKSSEKIACPSCGSSQTARKLSTFSAVATTAKPQIGPAGCGRCGSASPCPNG